MPARFGLAAGSAVDLAIGVLLGFVANACVVALGRDLPAACGRGPRGEDFFFFFFWILFEITVREQNQLPAIAAWCGWERGEDRFFGVVWVFHSARQTVRIRVACPLSIVHCLLSIFVHLCISSPTTVGWWRAVMMICQLISLSCS